MKQINRYMPDASVINMADRIKADSIKLIFDDGVDDFLIEVNRELHRRLVFNGTPHEYSERPGHIHGRIGKILCPTMRCFFQKSLKKTV